MVGVPGDMLGEPQRVIADQILGAFGVARLERLDDVHVIADRPVGPIVVADRPAQHIHYLITAPGHKTLITQAYFATDPFFEGNPEKNWHKNNIAGHKELVMPVRLFEGGSGPGAEPPHAEITFDIVLEKA